MAKIVHCTAKASAFDQEKKMIFFIIPVFRLNVLAIWFMWLRHCISLSINTPRYFILSTNAILSPCICTLIFAMVALLLYIWQKVFVVFNDNLFVLNQSIILGMSASIMSCSFDTDLSSKKIAVSSAYKRHDDLIQIKIVHIQNKQ